MEQNNFAQEKWEKFTDELKGVFGFIESTLINEHPALSINENYFLLSIFQQYNCLAYKIIETIMSSTALKLIHDAYYALVVKGQIIAIKPNRKISYDDKFHNLIEEGFEEMKLLNDERLSTIHIILALINPEKDHLSVQKIMKGAGLNYQILTKKLISLKNEDNKEEEEIKEETTKKEEEKSKNKKNKNIDFDFLFDVGTKKSFTGQYLSTYCINLNKLAKEGKIDPIIGRDYEIEKISKIFNRRKRNNLVIVGEKGSGKTCICESLAYLIVNNQAPYSLQNKTILKLDISSIIAGTTYRGMFEERAKGIFTELQKNPNCILFIDDFHNHTTKKDGESNTDITPYLKEVIDDGSIKVITTCTPKGYHKKFDNDQSLANKFQRIDLSTLNDEKIKEIILNVKKTYEKYHSIFINENNVDLMISLCKKYITDKEMPDSIIDLIDEIGACVSEKYKESEEIKNLKIELKKYSLKKKELLKSEKFDEVDEISEKETEILNKIKEIEKKNNCKTIEITEEIILNILSEKTGIPIQNLNSDNKKDLNNLNDKLKKIIIGQDEAIDKVCKTIKRKRLGLYTGRSTALFMQGKSGCGKSYLAKQLAKELFGSENAMIRFDMSEYSDSTSVNKLIGSNAGYVGYEEGGLLTEAVKNKKHCILLLDEIEKAHNNVFNIFLQVFDEGFLTDNTGQKVDFKNVIILLTSNVGAKVAAENSKTIGFSVKNNENEKSKSILEKELKKKFSPEFLNRLDAIIYFNNLSEENLKEIVKLELNKSLNRFKDIGYNVLYNENIINYLYDLIKEDSDYGARPIIRIIQNEVEDKLTDFILENDEIKNLFVDFIENKIEIIKKEN